jgi:hypothetical protein
MTWHYKAATEEQIQTAGTPNGDGEAMARNRFA